MNARSNTTRPTDEAIVAGMRDLEGDIHALHCMVNILGDMLDHDLVEYIGGEKRQMPDYGSPLKVVLVKQQVDCLSFAWNDVIERAHRLDRKYLDALCGKAVS